MKRSNLTNICKVLPRSISLVRNENGVCEEISKLCEDGDLLEALKATEFAERGGFLMGRNHAYILLQRCEKEKDLKCGRRVLLLMFKTSLNSIAVLGDHLIRLFTYGESLVEANHAFQKITDPTAYTWSAIISANAKLEQEKVALELYHEMGLSAVTNDKFIYLAVLKACAIAAALLEGRLIHSQIIREGLHLDIVVGNTVVDMYAKCGSLEEAQKLFCVLPGWDVVSFGVMIAGQVQHGEGLCAIQYFEKMQVPGVKPNQTVYLSILKACSRMGAIENGRLIHVEIIISKLDSDILVGNTLISMYAKCGSLEEAYRVFNKMPNHDTVSWGAMIAGYTLYEDGFASLKCFEEMQKEGVRPNTATFLALLKACTNLQSVEQGRFIHYHVIENELQADVMVGSTLIDMYAKCGSLEEACEAFNRLPMPNVVSWSAMVAAYVQHGDGINALKIFERMKEEGIMLDKVILLGILQACASVRAIQQGRLIHEYIIRNGLQLDVLIGSTLVDMYAKCRSLDEAYKCFYELKNMDIVSWGALISGYAQHGEDFFVLDCFKRMQYEGIKPDDATYVSVLKSCAIVGAIEQGKSVHDQILRSSFKLNIAVGNALVEMYAKCGSLEEAHVAFHNLPFRDMISWDAIIAGYALHAHGFLALDYFESMQQDGLKPDEVMFTNILIACSRAGLLDQGSWYFVSISEYQGILSTVSHCNCMIDVLGRAGWLSEAEDLLQSNIQSNIIGWTTLLAACQIHSNLRLARYCFRQIVLQGGEIMSGV